MTREKSGVVRTVFRVHDPKSPTRSAPFEALARLPRILEPAQQLLRDDALYVYHSKCNMKEAIKGEIWQWHQDYGAWRNGRSTDAEYDDRAADARRGERDRRLPVFYPRQSHAWPVRGGTGQRDDVRIGCGR